ncbi:MAG TPA: hypothetical protein DCL44_08790 [Elusimicrobia bacterium]|nr:hypothetical protein [Elusimicrobiota bacterium]
MALEEQKNDISADNAQLLKELELLRGRQKLFKIVAGVFFAIFIAGVIFAVYRYRKISAASQAFESIEQAFPSQELVKMMYENKPGASAPGVSFSSGPVSSSLTTFTNASSPDAGGMAGPVDPGTTYKALAKYMDRPIVKEFIGELKKDPSFREALANSGGNNPMKVMADIRKIKGMDKITEKFAFRPDFMKLMMEVMSDPELKPLLGRIPQAGRVIPMGAFGAKAAQAGDGSTPAEGTPHMPEDTGVKFDPTAISGGEQSAPASVKRKAPPPIGN